MSRFDSLTKYIPLITEGSIGIWFIDNENDGTIEHPQRLPYVIYTKLADDFIKDVYEFIKQNEDLGLRRYFDILEENGLIWNMESMSNADVSSLDAKCIVALIVGAVRAEGYQEGALLAFFDNGCILRWLERLKEME